MDANEPLYQLPRMPKEVPPGALAREQRLRVIRDTATVSDRLAAYKGLLEPDQLDPLAEPKAWLRAFRKATQGHWQRFW